MADSAKVEIDILNNDFTNSLQIKKEKIMMPPKRFAPRPFPSPKSSISSLSSPPSLPVTPLPRKVSYEEVENDTLKEKNLSQENTNAIIEPLNKVAKPHSSKYEKYSDEEDNYAENLHNDGYGNNSCSQEECYDEYDTCKPYEGDESTSEED